MTALMGFIEQDRGATPNADFRFFTAFAHEVMDRYGRLLGYINVDVPQGAPRPESYNERQLKAGMAFPYFIWPNVNPFRKQGSVVAAVPPSADANAIQHESALKSARDAVQLGAKEARQDESAGYVIVTFVHASSPPLELSRCPPSAVAHRPAPLGRVLES